MRKIPEPSGDRLSPYRRKRAAGRTPEPFGPVAPAPPGRPGRFVVQQHAARRLHWDFRLEMGGVLVSWAVPKGPSLDPSEKRLAVAVEDHPLDYAEFEGTIPAGNYGAGAVIVWDQGFWTPIDDPADHRERGKLLFDLHGYKLRGRWTLVKTRRSERDWLLIKKADPFATKEEPPGESVLSGQTLEELRDGNPRQATVRSRLPRTRTRSRLRPAAVDLMLASPALRPFSSDDWIYELKYDGYRLLAGREGSEVDLRTRGGHDATASFPEVARAVGALPWEHFVLDGEIVVLDEEGRPRFQRLQQRVRRNLGSDVDRATVEHPATFYAFDLLALDGVDLRHRPLLERKELLAAIVPPRGPIRYADHVTGMGEALFERATAAGLEGIVAKRADSPYHGQRSDAWKKIRIDRSDDFAVIGFTRPKGSRTGFGALHLAQRDTADWVYAGRVGSGFEEQELALVAAHLEDAPRTGAPALGSTPKTPGQVWIEPTLVCEVRFRERTGDGLLRQPVFLRFRDDKLPEECIVPGGAEPDPPAAVVPARPQVVLSNPDKIFWPAEGYTKRDLFEYYQTIAPAMLPYLRDRPVVLRRFPDGIDGKSFYQKDAPGFVPAWLRTERIWSGHAEREIDYFVCDDVESLLYLANLGTIPVHAWASRASALTRPDWCILDLDPKGAPFRDVVRVAREIRRLCDEIALPSFPKTSGASGLHVLLPLGGSCTYEQSRQLGELLARVIVARLPDLATIVRPIGSREGRVYVDFLQNRHGQTIAAPFSVRPLPGATVSTPLRWTEVTPRLHPSRFTIRTVPPRVRRMRQDPLSPVLRTSPDLTTVLDRLHRAVTK